jgi:uncharacterized LabA/DUF88 family protein
MTDTYLTTNGKTSQQQSSVSVFWDIQNVSLKFKSLRNFSRELQYFASNQGKLTCQNVYYNSQYQNQVNNKIILEQLGFKCVDVPCDRKNSADNQLIADCVKWVAFNHSSTIILVLGDKDFAGLICLLNSLGKKVIIFAQRGSISQKLIKIVGKNNWFFSTCYAKLLVKPQTFLLNKG